jgi:Flp pilus assembly protein TadB
MTRDEEIEELEKNQRLSRKAISIYAAMLVFLAVALWLVNRITTIPVWVFVIVLGLTAATLIGDILNLCRCRRRLRELKSY